ncbi:MAG: hypothetical protein ACR2LX_07320 [Jatrophihabitans sp.]
MPADLFDRIDRATQRAARMHERHGNSLGHFFSAYPWVAYPLAVLVVVSALLSLVGKIVTKALGLPPSAVRWGILGAGVLWFLHRRRLTEQRGRVTV